MKKKNVLRVILHNAEVYNEKHQRKKEFLIIFHGRYNEKKRLVALKRAQAHRVSTSGPRIVISSYIFCCCVLCHFYRCAQVHVHHTQIFTCIHFVCVIFFFVAFPAAIPNFVYVFVCRSSFYSIHFFFISHCYYYYYCYVFRVHTQMW